MHEELYDTVQCTQKCLIGWWEFHINTKKGLINLTGSYWKICYNNLFVRVSRSGYRQHTDFFARSGSATQASM